MTDDIFGLSGKALQLTEDRSVTLTNNIVNGGTPNYKARDIDFHKLLQDANQIAQPLLTNNPRQLQPSTNTSGEPLLYRVPMQQSADGNTVDEEIERKNFLENAMNYQVNLTFIQNKSDQPMKAIKGE